MAKGTIVELRDGRQGTLLYSEQKGVQAGKAAVNVWTRKPQLELFAGTEYEKPDFLNIESVRTICDRAGLKVIAFLD